METLTSVKTDWKQTIQELGQSFAARAAEHDHKGDFVFDNYEELKKHRIFSFAIPEEFGGLGMSHSETCEMLRLLAKDCASTALAHAMHQHLIAAAVWKYKHKGESAPLLQRVSDGQLVLVSTGARDWLDSNGEMKRTEGGYLLSAKKFFASQSVAGNIAVTSAPYQHPEKGWQVLHFAVPFNSKGVSVLDDWHVMGMRATGSQTIVFDEVFVPDASIVLERPRTGFHPVWDLVIGVACPLIMSVYVGIAEKAMEIAIQIGKSYPRNQQHLPYIIGKMNNSLVAARAQWKRMIAIADDLNFKPDAVKTLEMLSLKTNTTEACIRVVTEAMDAIGGQSFYEKNQLERLFRDVHAAGFHPMPAWEQYAFTGNRILNAEA